MEEKKVTKISLSTYLLVIAIFAIVVMGALIYKLNNDKNTEIKKSANLQAQVNSLNGTVSDLQGKITNISETISSNSANESNLSNNGSSKDIKDTNANTTPLSENEALNILKAKFDIIEKIYFSPDKFFNVTAGEEIKNFDKTILKYGTDNLLKEIKNNLPMCIKLENGKYYFLEGGGAIEYVGFDKFENIKVTNSTITATLKTKQSTFNGNDLVSANDKSSEFILVKNSNEWLIDKMNSSDFN